MFPGGYMEQPKLERCVRLAVEDDAPQIAEVLYTAFSEYRAAYTLGGFATTTPDAEKIQSRMHEGPTWVALQNGAIVGTISAVLQGGSLYIRGMAILPGARGSGTGKLLLDYVETYALEHGCNRLFLSTTPFLSRAIKLYEQAGFARSDEGPGELFGTPLFTMEKTLSVE